MACRVGTLPITYLSTCTVDAHDQRTHATRLPDGLARLLPLVRFARVSRIAGRSRDGRAVRRRARPGRTTGDDDPPSPRGNFAAATSTAGWSLRRAIRPCAARSRPSRTRRRWKRRSSARRRYCPRSCAAWCACCRPPSAACATVPAAGGAGRPAAALGTGRAGCRRSHLRSGQHGDPSGRRARLIRVD